jgi:predicted DNA-binding protein (MmcQ/YjbR family)
MPQTPFDHLRALCLALPQAEERETWARATYRVRDKIFAIDGNTGERPCVWVKAPPGSQAVLVGADPRRFFAPPYLGPKGWVGIWLDAGADWHEVDALVRRSYRQVAPKKLAALLAPPADETL